MFLYCHINTLTCANLHLLSTLSSTGHGGTSTEAAARNQRVTTQGSGTPKRRKGLHLNWEMEGALDGWMDDAPGGKGQSHTHCRGKLQRRTPSSILHVYMCLQQKRTHSFRGDATCPLNEGLVIYSV